MDGGEEREEREGKRKERRGMVWLDFAPSFL